MLTGGARAPPAVGTLPGVSISTTLAVGLIAALAAVITGAVSLLAQLIANANARKTATADRAAALKADRERRQFEAQERRYADRREALITFNLAAQALAKDMDYLASAGLSGPSDELVEALDLALVRVGLLCPESVGNAAGALVDAILQLGHPPPVRQAEREFHAASRGLLGEGDLRLFPPPDA